MTKTEKIHNALKRAMNEKPDECKYKFSHAAQAYQHITDNTISVNDLIGAIEKGEWRHYKGRVDKDKYKNTSPEVALYRKQAAERFMLGFVSALTPLGFGYREIAQMYIETQGTKNNAETVRNCLYKLHHRYTGRGKIDNDCIIEEYQEQTN